MSPNDPMDRRAFVRSLPVVGALSLGAMQSGCGGLPYVPATPVGDELHVRVADLGAGGSAFVNVPGGVRPIFIHRSDRGPYVAVLAECTHRQCVPEPAGDRLVCPCHGSEYTLDGEVVEGPAERDLPRFDVREEGAGPQDRVLIIELGGAS